MFQNSKLIKTFQLLSPQEQNALKNWLDSPWCNSNKKLSPFYQLIIKHNNKFTSSRFSDEKLFFKLFNNKVFNKQLLSNLKYEFVKQIEKFLVFEQLKKEKDCQKKLLSRSYLAKNNFDKYQKNTRLIIDSKLNKQLKEWNDYLDLTLLYESLFFLPTDKVFHKPLVKDLLAVEENLELFYALGKFRINLAKTLDPRIEHKNFNFKQLQQLRNNNQHPAIELYYLRITRPKKWGYSHFLKFKSALLNSFASLSLKDQQLLLLSAINDTVVLYSKKELCANQDMHELYDFGFKNKTLVFNNRITGTAFANMISISIKLGKDDYVKKFIKNYTKNLPEEFQQEANVWAKAQIL
ncbi:MAG TPA: hypothetical protein ENK52_04705, partial [Saprospiraceae bacterium]|nr:hypothetical protein [Saprospiraceae bacterium]